MSMQHSLRFALVLATLITAVPAQFTFAAPVASANPLGGTQNAAQMRVANLNGDAYPDLLLCNFSSTAVALNNEPTSAGFTLSTITGLSGGLICGADLDHDGYDDLVLGSTTSSDL